MGGEVLAERLDRGRVTDIEREDAGRAGRVEFVGALGLPRGAPHLVAIGESADDLAAAATVPVTMAGSLEEAVDVARNTATAGDGVLLSPGCASFDMFEDYQARGDAFTELVNTAERALEQA